LYLYPNDKYLIYLNNSNGGLFDIENLTGNIGVAYDWSGEEPLSISDDNSIFITNTNAWSSIIRITPDGKFEDINNINLLSFPGITLPPDNYFLNIDISSDNKTAAFLSKEHRVCLWSIDEKNPKFCLPDETGRISFIKFTPDSRSLLTFEDSIVKQWSIDTPELIGTYPKDYSINKAVFSHNGDFLIAREYSPEKEGSELVINKWKVNSDPDNTTPLFSLSGTIHSAKLQGDVFISLSNSRNPLFPLRLPNINSSYVIAGSKHGMTQVDMENGRFLSHSIYHSSSIHLSSSQNQKFVAFAYSPGSELIISAADLDGIFQTYKGLRTLPFDGKNWPICQSISISDTGLIAASFSSKEKGESMVGIWSISKGELINQLNEKNDLVTISSDGSLLAIRSQGRNLHNRIKIYSIKSPNQLDLVIDLTDKNPGGNEDLITSLAFNPDGKWLAAGDQFGKIVFYDTLNWQNQFSLVGHVDSITGLTFSSDGKNLFSTSNDGTIRVWGIPSSSTLLAKSTVTPQTENTKPQNVITNYPTEIIPTLDKEITTNGVSGNDSIVKIDDKNNWVFGNFFSDRGSCSSCVFGLWTLSEPKGKVLLSIYGNNHEIRSLDPSKKTNTDSLVHRFDEAPEEMTVSRDGSIFARGMSTDKGIILTDSEGKEIQTLNGFKYKNINALWISPDNKFLIVADTDIKVLKDSEITIWDIQKKPGVPAVKIPLTGKVTKIAGIINTSQGYDVYISREGIFNGSSLLKLELSANGAKKKIEEISGKLPERIRNIALTTDGKLLAVVTLESMIEIFETSTIQKLAEIPSVEVQINGKEDNLSITDLDFYTDNTKLLVAYFDTSVRMIDIKK
jgi:WD40 repeat protein